MKPRAGRPGIAARFSAIFLACFCAPFAAGQSAPGVGATVPGTVIPGRHRGAITALLRDAQGRLLSAGEDGFLGIWNNQAAEERFQLCPNGIQYMALRPGKPEISIIESDGMGLYRISAWNYETKKNLFTLRFRDSVSYLNYSAAGSFLIVARSGRTGVAFIHAETGEVLESPDDLSGAVAFAATSRSERVMICYQSSGILSYWDLETGNELQHFDVPPGIRSPALFGNYCFLGGIDSQGLVILDAVTGAIMARDQNVRQGMLFADNPEPAESRGSAQFNCFLSAGNGAVHRMEINLQGRLTTITRRNLPQSASNSQAGVAVSTGHPASSGGGNYFFGAGSGAVWSVGSTSRELRTGNPGRVGDIAASSSAIAFLTDRGELGFLPLDYALLEMESSLALDSAQAAGASGYNSIVSGITDSANPELSRFLLWQSGSNRSVPMIRTLSGPPLEANTSRMLFDRFQPRFPIRSASALGNSILFLDTSGSVTVLDNANGEIRFNYSASGAADAAFLRPDTIILGRSVAAGSTPFMAINSSTGETVPLAYPAMVGVRVYRGSSGTIYGAVVNQSGGNTQTSIIALNMSNPAQSERLIEFSGEDSGFTMAESGGNLASTLGSGGATLYRGGRARTAASEIIQMERSAGLPVKIIDGNRWFITLDAEGGIAWHDNRTGELRAVFRLYPNLWVLESGGETIWGKTVRK